MSVATVFPIDYEKFTYKMMTLPLPGDVDYGTELFGHKVHENQKTEFNEKRGQFISVFGWRVFWDKVGTHQPHYLYNRGHLYDTENGLGYIGDMITGVDGKPFPKIKHWALRTRLNHPKKGMNGIDKTDAIYYYESLDMR